MKITRTRVVRRRIKAVVVVAGASLVIGLRAMPALGQCELQKLTATDAVGCDRCGDIFGRSVSIDGNLIAVGAPDGVPDSPPSAIPGATYIFRREGLGWIEEAKIVPDDAEPNDSIGGKVSISGNRVLMGALGRDGFTGAAYIFRREGTTWVQEAKLTPDDTSEGDTFGIGLCLSGDVAVVGAWGDDEAEPNAGAAYVFRRDDKGTPLDPSDDVWPQEDKLIPDDAAPGDLFGIDCSISGNRVVVGATQANPGTFRSTKGKAYVFRREGINWVQEAVLTGSDTAEDDNFGFRVAIDGDTVLVSAWAHDAACNTCLNDSDCSGNCGGNCTEGCGGGCCIGCCNTSNGTCIECNSGAVYAFRRTGNTWVETQKLTALDTGEGDNFGKDVALLGDLAVVGVDGDDDFAFNTGAAYIFRREGNVWIEESKLTANDPEESDLLGFSVSLSGGLVVLGSFNDDDACPTNADCNSGSAYVFDLAGADCNDNSICDSRDIADGTSQDLNGNGVPDECDQGGCGALLVQVNEHRVGPDGSTIVGIEGLELCVFDKSPGSCARDIGISKRHYLEVFNTCEPVACSTTDADGSARIGLDAGDYVLIGEYDPDGFPPNEDGDELFIGVSASDFQCAVDGDPNTVTMRKHLQVIILPNGRTVGMDPRGAASGPSTRNGWVEMTNVGGPDDSISVTAVDEDLHAAAGPYKATGTAMGIDSSLSPGQLFMTILIPFRAEDLAGSEPLSVDLTYYNRSTRSWELAVGSNDQPSPDHGLDVIGDRFAVVGTAIPVLSDELGDYGVFWNPDLGEGLVWANVDYTAEFANARLTQGGPVPTVSEWGLIVMGLLGLTVGTILYGRRRTTAAR